VASRRRTVLLALVLGSAIAVLPHVPAGAAPAQDPGSEVIVGGQVGSDPTTTSTTAPPTTTTAAPATTTAPDDVVEEPAEDGGSTRLVTESRKVLAVIAGLVFVALALMLLTIRYWKATKPVAETEAEGPLAATGTAPAVALADAEQAEPAPTASKKPAEAESAASASATSTSAASEPADADSPVLVGAAAAAAGATPSGSVPSVQTPAPGTDHTSADDDWQPRTGEHERVEIPRKPSTARPSRAARRKALGIDADA
jgi:hypothetical protein